MVSFSARLGAREIVAVDGRADAFQRVAQPGPELTVPFTILETLSMRLERGCMRSHVIATSGTPNRSTATGLAPEPLSSGQESPWPCPSSICGAPTATSRPLTTSRSRSMPGKSSASSAPTGPARPPLSVRWPASSSRPSGQVRIDGHDIVTAPLEAKRRLAFMPDEPHLFDYLTVTEHLRLMGRLYGIAGHRSPGGGDCWRSSS